MATRQLPALTSSRLATAMAHPTRLHAMRVLTSRIATPAEIATEIGEPINNVAYHIKVLSDLDCIELVQVKSAHGGRVKEHFYKAIQQPYFDDEAWAQLDEGKKLDVTVAIIQQISRDVADAMSHGTFCTPDDAHFSRVPLLVDQEGWEEVNGILADTLAQMFTVRENVIARDAGVKETFPVKVNLLLYQSPPEARETI